MPEMMFDCERRQPFDADSGLYLVARTCAECGKPGRWWIPYTREYPCGDDRRPVWHDECMRQHLARFGIGTAEA